ncbi:ATP-binding cassette domain-containing protein [bacterium AH-315-P07]|nr:ATP-binding cassette domain-containing protein [bacterium AH-315-P07]
MSEVLLDVRDLKTHFPVKKGLLFTKTIGVVKAVDGVSLQVRRGDILGLVGESGCGKSTLARSILDLIPATSGTVLLEGQSLQEMSSSELRIARRAAQMVFQDPNASLNPRMTVFTMLAEPMLAHGLAVKNTAVSQVAELMERVGLAPRFMKKYPHEFSGGQRQRIAIARALALKPKLIIADEPVSALDVSVQAQILNLLAKLCREDNLSLIFITHDLSVVRHIATSVAVMYLGRIVEEGPTHAVLNSPQHPYTQALISAVPIPDPEKERRREQILLEGDLPSPMNPPSGCPFHPRCPKAEADCVTTIPDWVASEKEHRTACLHIDNPSG